MYLIYVLLLISSALCMDVVTIGGQVFSDGDFFDKYGRNEWNRSDNKQKNRMLRDYIKREACAIQAKSLGFFNDPGVVVKLRDRSNMVMVNSVYEELVAKPLVPDAVLSKTRNNIKTEIDVAHILIAHKNSQLQQPPNRTKDEAFFLIQDIKNRLNSGGDFVELAKKYSDDPSAKKNGGALGWVGWGRTAGEFQDAAFVLGVGGFSEPVLTGFGYHLIWVIDKRDSEYAQLSGKVLEEAVYNASRGVVSHLLRKAATQFDSLRLAGAGVKYNNNALVKILNLVVEEKNRKKLSGQYKVDLVSLFEGSDELGVVCVYNKRGLGIKWFSQKLRGTPSSRHPSIESVEDIKTAFNIILLQDLAVSLGLEKRVFESRLYLNQVKAMENSLLYDIYLKWLVNTAEKPDSLQIKAYYEENKDNKYKEPIKVVVREIKVLNRDLADSLLLELEFGLDFEEAAMLYSKTNPSGGGLIQPFAEGKYNDMGRVAFSTKTGQVSTVIENLDRSFSIIRVEEKLPEKITDLKRVYARIESLLTRESQNKAKEVGVDGLFEELNIIINSNFFSEKRFEEN